MGKNFSLKLAFTNIKNHRKFYLPYFLAAVGIIAMFYIICFLAMSRGVAEMSDSLSVIMGLGVFVMAIFSFIFLFYTNSFLMKRRKKEIGLYNILGMEKQHIGRILAIENIIVSCASMASGLFCGVLFSKLVYLFLSWVFGTEPPFGIEISPMAIFYSIVLFGILFALTLVSNQMSIRLAKPIELLYGGNVGEKEPGARWLLAMAGFICLGAGYYIAITTESPFSALAMFFVAVVLVIVGTYCLFTAGSIAILKALRKNKKFYYRPKNFTAVSGLIYRMKQNAVGLANICILSTMVLVMVSGTVSLYFGMNDTINAMAPGDVNTMVFTREGKNLNEERVQKIFRASAEETGVKVEKSTRSKMLPFVAVKKYDNYIFDEASRETMDDANVFCLLTEESYQSLTGETLGLSQGQAAVDSRGEELPDRFGIGTLTFDKVKTLKPFMESGQVNAGMENVHYMVVSDDETVQELYRQQREVYQGNASNLTYQYVFYTEATEEQNQKFAEAVLNRLYEELDELELSSVSSESREQIAVPLRGFVSGFLFLGVFLGIVFTFAAALIIYYKQISEGYYDKEKFEIMQKVGMSKSEVKAAIRRQVLLVFFVPLIMAGIHVTFAFKMITKLLLVFSMTNVNLFALCTLGTFLVFAVIYALVYMVTAREYYKIVG